MKTYKISKAYENKPSRNTTESRGLSIEQAIRELDIIEMLWEKNGGIVEVKTEDSIVCSESDDSERITWTIIEEEE